MFHKPISYTALNLLFTDNYMICGFYLVYDLNEPANGYERNYKIKNKNVLKANT